MWLGVGLGGGLELGLRGEAIARGAGGDGVGRGTKLVGEL